MLFSIIIVCTLGTTIAHSDIQKHIPCPEECSSCSGHVANCSRINVPYIPPLPPDITTILFTNNRLYHVSKDTFKNINHLRIQHIDISNCRITHIEDDAFSDLPYLIGLNITGVKLHRFPVVSSLINLTSLDISDNGLSEIHEYLDRFQRLNELVANNNKIRGIYFQNMSRSLVTLSLRENDLTILNFSCASGANLNYYLEYLDISKNFLTDLSIFQRNGHCLPKLRTLFLDNLPIRDIPDLTFAYMTSLRQLSLDFIGRLKSIQPLAFSNPSLEIIHIGSAKSFELSNDSVELFQNTTNLKNLTTIQLKFPENDPEFLKKFIAPLRHLRNLTFKFADISNVPERFLEHTPNLSSLTLVGNLFSKWENNIFPSSDSLRYIDFGLNHITDIDADSFPVHILKNILMLDLSKNPFVCSCTLFWFRKKWIPENMAKLRNYPETYYCESPQAMKTRQVQEYNPSAADCLDPLVLMAIILSLCLFVICFICVLLYRYRWHIKYYIYLCCVRRGYKKIEEDKYYFDAFVAYNGDDRTWILTNLMPFLEKQQKMRLCLHDRDFVPGTLMVDNIVENMRKSRKLILVLSNSFIASEWCKFELLMAQSRFLEEGSATLILIMLEGVSVNQMSEPLSVLLQNKSTIDWTNDPTGRNLFWNELLSSLN